MSPRILLAGLLGLAIAASGWISSFHWKTQAAGKVAVEPDSARVSELRQQIERLEREVSVLQSLAQGGGNLPVDPDLRAFVETHTELTFLQTPRVEKGSRERLDEAVRDRLQALYGPSGLEKRSTYWKHLGLIPQNQKLESLLVALETTGARGVLGSEGIVMADDFDNENLTDQASLVRLLSLLLLEQHSPAEGIQSDDAWWARQALHHGKANAVMGSFQVRQARALGTLPQGQTASEAAELLDLIPPFLRTVQTFPSLYGANVLSATAAEFPPTSALSTSHFLSQQDRQPGALGQLGLYAALCLVTSESEALALATHLEHDALEESNGTLSWILRFDSEEPLEAISVHLNDLFDAAYPPDSGQPAQLQRVRSLNRPAQSVLSFQSAPLR